MGAAGAPRRGTGRATRRYECPAASKPSHRFPVNAGPLAFLPLPSPGGDFFQAKNFCPKREPSGGSPVGIHGRRIVHCRGTRRGLIGGRASRPSDRVQAATADGVSSSVISTPLQPGAVFPLCRVSLFPRFESADRSAHPGDHGGVIGRAKDGRAGHEGIGASSRNLADVVRGDATIDFQAD